MRDDKVDASLNATLDTGFRDLVCDFRAWTNRALKSLLSWMKAPGAPQQTPPPLSHYWP